MTDLTAFVEAMDRCWMERRFGDLSDFLSDNVVIVAPGGVQRAERLSSPNGAIPPLSNIIGR